MEDAPSTPRSRLKFLCSFGGRILPRPSDGLLRYVGGETRVLSVPSSIKFTELKEKLDGMFNAEVAVKYQLMAEDLDALVSVKNDEDLFHMLDEYDRLERHPRSPTSAASPRFRVFLFPTSSASAAAAKRESGAPLDQRYVGCINGSRMVPATRPSFTVSSEGSSPTSAMDSWYAAAEPCLLMRPNAGRRGMGGGAGMQRVRSTPNLGGGESQAGSPRGWQKVGGGMGYGGGGMGWRAGGGIRQDGGWGCGCVNSPSTAQFMRRYVCSPPRTAGGVPVGGSWVEGSPPRRGREGFHFGPPPPLAALSRDASRY